MANRILIGTRRRLSEPEAQDRISQVLDLLNILPLPGEMALQSVTTGLRYVSPAARVGARRMLGEVARGFGIERFPWIERVKVVFPDGTAHFDEIKGLNAGHALARAAENWEGAKYIVGLGPGTP